MTNETENITISKTALKEMMCDFAKELKQTPHYDGESIDFIDYMNNFMAGKKASVAKNTYAKYENHYRVHVLPYFKGKSLCDITKEVLQGFFSELIDKDLSAETIKCIRCSLLNRALKDAAGQELIKSNPMDYVKTPKIKQDSRRRPFTDDEIRRIGKAVGNDYKAIAFRLLIETGMRREELLPLTWEDVDLEQGTIRINKTYVEGDKGHPYLNHSTKTKGSTRTILISPGLVSALKHHKEVIQKNSRTYIVCQKANDKMVDPNNFRNKWFNSWLEKAGIQKGKAQLCVHTCRHTFVTILYEQGVDEKTIMRQTGHTNIKSLQRYTDTGRTDKLQRECANTIGDYFSNLVS